jgi:hypothetical protein
MGFVTGPKNKPIVKNSSSIRQAASPSVRLLSSSKVANDQFFAGNRSALKSSLVQKFPKCTIFCDNIASRILNILRRVTHT